jgi:uncharacterized protein YdeI (YjbR/CyaY-like superfamily)
MSPTPTPHDVLFLTTPEELRDWFDANHATADELWLGSYKKASGRPFVTWSEAVDEALCVGWIDGVRYSLDDTSHAQRFTPRRKGSTWSAINVAKVAALTEQGRMRPAGLAAFEARDPAKTAIYSYELDAAAFSAQELAQFQANALAWQRWEREPPGYRKQATHWVTSAKRDETRTKRMAELIEMAAAGERPKPFRVRRA